MAINFVAGILVELASACGLQRSHILVSLGEESVAWVLPRALPSGGLSWLRGGVWCRAPAFRAFGPFPGWCSNHHPPRALWASVSLSLWHRRRSPSACRMCVRPLRSVLVWVLTF
jgi:hypothetical protein